MQLLKNQGKLSGTHFKELTARIVPATVEELLNLAIPKGKLPHPVHSSPDTSPKT